NRASARGGGKRRESAGRTGGGRAGGPRRWPAVGRGTLASARRSFVARAGRLARERSATEIAQTVVRASRRSLASRRIELELKRAARRGAPVLLRPFLGEVGFELLYWIPMTRRLMKHHGIEPERVIAYTRGGAGAWYEDFADRSLDLYTVVEPDEFRSRLAERRAHAGDDKMLSVEALDRRLMDDARARFGEVAVVHPILMYSRLRWIWQGERAPETIHQYAD